MGREGPLGAGGRRGGREQVRRGRGPGAGRGRAPARRRSQGSPRRGVPRFADRLLSPDLPTIPADPEGAYALLAQARSLAKGETLRASLLLAMARASQKAGNHARAIADFQAYLGEYPKGADRTAVRYGLGESQLAAGQALPARLTWTDLARDLEKVDTGPAADTRARALYGIAKTHGIPTPPDDSQMNLGVAALRRMLASYPSHPLAVRASHDIASSYLARGKSQEALAAFEAFIKRDDPGGNDDARRERAELLMSAQFLIGRILQGQGKFDEAIAAYKGYLAKYPNGPQSADAQRAVLDSQVQIAQDLQRRERYADARAAFLAFTAQNPLDGRVPQLLFEVGQTAYVEKKYDDAIVAWETLAGKFPGSEPAGHAQFAVASIYENEKGDPAAAIERYRKVAGEPWHGQAAQRIALMEAKALAVITERTFRSGETPRLKVATRNLEKLTFTAYKIDPETYFRKKHTLSGVEALDIGLVAPDAEWTAEVPGYARYRPIETTYELKKLEMPGVYVVKVSDDKTLQATTLVLGSDLDAIAKTSRDQILVFAQDMKTGKGRAGARVLVSDDEGVILDAHTGK
ncbi:MAG TPA: tetratricopeptide repeat protein, partial [Isosphaeraceae bacterium]